MTNKSNVNNYDTIYASKYTYDIESYVVKNSIDLGTKSRQNMIKGAIRNKDIEVPADSNLNYLDSFYDSSTGTSGTAFKDTETGEVIIAYTGTNAKVDKQDVVTDIESVALGEGYHYDSAYQFYDKIADKYGTANLTVTGHSLGGNIAQRVPLKKNAQNTIVYNAAPLYFPTAPFVTAGLTKNPALALAVLVGSSDNVNDIKKDQANFTGKVTRFRTQEDPLTKASNAAGGVYIGEDYVITDSGGHSIDAIIDDSKQMKQVQKAVQKIEQDSDLRVQKAIHTVDDQMKSVQTMKDRYASGGLSDSEKIE
ncbi:DUF6792 domain-containing protein [Streptococcus dentapri]|uniref:DUF6792 domain-containing protein n=1 Tax=Streptococcus dentapri TaxID=573564 RepID=A0ABV8CZF9_9STRE